MCDSVHRARGVVRAGHTPAQCPPRCPGKPREPGMLWQKESYFGPGSSSIHCDVTQHTRTPARPCRPLRGQGRQPKTRRGGGAGCRPPGSACGPAAFANGRRRARAPRCPGRSPHLPCPSGWATGSGVAGWQARAHVPRLAEELAQRGRAGRQPGLGGVETQARSPGAPRRGGRPGRCESGRGRPAKGQRCVEDCRLA